jgi:hypothetical protein
MMAARCLFPSWLLTAYTYSSPSASPRSMLNEPNATKTL